MIRRLESASATAAATSCALAVSIAAVAVYPAAGTFPLTLATLMGGLAVLTPKNRREGGS